MKVLDKYLVREFLYFLLITSLIIVSLIGIVEVIELTRKLSNANNANISILFKLSILKLPNTINLILPFLILFSCSFTLIKFNAYNEIIIALANGISVWRILKPFIITVILIAIFKLLVLNTIAAKGLNLYDQYIEKLIGKKQQFYTLAQTGIWIKENYPNNLIINANRIDMQTKSLQNVRAFIFDNEYNLKTRIDAKKAVLKKGKLNFIEAYYSNKNDLMEYKKNIEIDTAITVGKLFNSITFPEHLNMFELPKFIRNINDAGFPAISHKLYFYQQLTAPILFCAMVLISTCFIIVFGRNIGYIRNFSKAIASGFLIIFITKATNNLILKQEIPLWLGIIIPVLISMLLSIALLIHKAEHI